jgi:hypothetical protein
MECRPLTRDMLRDPQDVNAPEDGLDFNKAKNLADEKARSIRPDAMLLSWYDRKSGKYSPNVECCGEEKPSWLIYAESRGGDLSVSVNNEEFVFVYL